MAIVEYEPGAAFPGVIGRTAEESAPAWPAPVRARDGAPNVVFIVLDDTGFGQLGCYGSPIETPSFDALAANGLRLSAVIEPEAWAIDDTGFPKFGRRSVGVTRRYCAALGKLGNCQIGVSVSAVTPQASCLVDWRMYLPQEWDQDPRRQACRVPDEMRHQPKWKLALNMIDELAGWGVQPRPVLGDAAYGDITEFRLGLQERGLQYVLDVKGTTSALGENAQPQAPRKPGPGRPPKPRYRRPFSSVAALVAQAGPDVCQQVTWREGTRGPDNASTI